MRVTDALLPMTALQRRLWALRGGVVILPIGTWVPTEYAMHHSSDGVFHPAL